MRPPEDTSCTNKGHGGLKSHQALRSDEGAVLTPRSSQLARTCWTGIRPLQPVIERHTSRAEAMLGRDAHKVQMDRTKQITNGERQSCDRQAVAGRDTKCQSEKDSDFGKLFIFDSLRLVSAMTAKPKSPYP